MGDDDVWLDKFVTDELSPPMCHMNQKTPILHEPGFHQVWDDVRLLFHQDHLLHAYE